jgi:hypothetical protein
LEGAVARRQKAAQTVGIHVDRLGGDINKLALVIANPFRGQRLAVPRDVRLGDTPEGEPAILWSVPHWVSRDLKSPDYGRVDWASGGPADKAIWAFLELATESDPERFVTFTRRYGPLGLWPYRSGGENEKGQAIRSASLVDREGRDIWVPSIPVGVLTPFRYRSLPAEHDWWTPEGKEMLRLHYEPVEQWRRWARWTRAILQIALALRMGQLGTREQWIEFGIDIFDDWFRKRYLDINYQRRQLAAIVQFRFLKWSGLVPVIRWSDERPSLELALGGDHAVLMPRSSMRNDWPENALFPALVGSLLAIVLTGGPIAECAMCGKIHARSRMPRPDQSAYCDLCRPEAIRANKRRSAALARAASRRERADAESKTTTPISTPKPANDSERSRIAESGNR